MDYHAWKEFYHKGHGEELVVCRLDSNLATHLGDGHHAVILHHDILLKAISKHRLTFDFFPLISEAITYGYAYEDCRTPRKLDFYYHCRAQDCHIQVSVKLCLSTPDFYVTTFFKIRAKDLKKKRERNKQLRPT